MGFGGGGGLKKSVIFGGCPYAESFFGGEVLEAADVVLEVLDARDPQGCRSPQLEAAVRRAGSRQRLVLVLNKIGMGGGRGALCGAGGGGIQTPMWHGDIVSSLCVPLQTWCRGTWWPRG